MRTRYRIIPEYNMYFISSTIIDSVPLIINEDIFLIILNSFKFCQINKKLFIYGYVIMPNHFHIIISMDDASRIPSVVRDLKRHTSQEITIYLTKLSDQKHLFWIKPFWGKRIDNVWQPGYHPQAIISEEIFIQKLTYIHENPVKKGFVLKPEGWKYSSARNYVQNDHSVIKLDIDKIWE